MAMKDDDFEVDVNTKHIRYKGAAPNFTREELYKWILSLDVEWFENQEHRITVDMWEDIVDE